MRREASVKKNPPTFEMLMVDPTELSKFLYSCAYIQVLAADTIEITKSTGLLGGMGYALGLPGGSAKRVTERYHTNERKVMALGIYNNLLAEFRGMLDKPAHQLNFLSRLEAKRDRRRAEIQGKFANADAYNAASDAALTSGARFFNNVQAVCTIALCVLAPAAGAARGAAVFALVLSTKSVIAVAQSDKSWSALAAFTFGTVQNAVITVGELPNKVFELAKDASIDKMRSAMGLATANYAAEINNVRQRVLELQAEMQKTQMAALAEKPGSGMRNAMERSITQKAAEIEAANARMLGLRQGAVGASKGGQLLKGFGGTAVPVVCVAIDALSEYQRWWEVNDQIEYGASGGRRAPARR